MNQFSVFAQMSLIVFAFSVCARVTLWSPVLKIDGGRGEKRERKPSGGTDVLQNRQMSSWKSWTTKKEKRKTQLVAQWNPQICENIVLLFFDLSLCDELIRFPQKRRNAVC